MVPVVMVFSAMFAGTLPLWLHLARKRPWVRFRLLVLLLLFAGVSLIPFSFPGAALERAKAQGNLAEALLEKGDCARAAALLENAGADTESARSLNLYGRALLKLGRPQEAVLVFERAIPLFPRDHFSYMNLATTLASLGRVENVPMLFERAESLAGPSDRPEVWYNLGTVLMNAGDSDAAAVLFRRIERDHKHAPKALNYLGIIALEKSQFSDAAGFFREAAALVPNEPSYKVNLAVALCEAGALEEAKGILLDVLRTHPDDIQARGLYSDYFSGTPSSAP